jgi:hypothetical protein
MFVILIGGIAALGQFAFYAGILWVLSALAKGKEQ